MGWLLGKGTLAQKLKVPLYPKDSLRMALWCTDYKGEFMLGDKRYCYPPYRLGLRQPLSFAL